MKHLGTLAFAGSMLALAFTIPASAAPATSGLGKSQVAPGVTSQVEQARCWRRCWWHRGHKHCRWVCRRHHWW